MSLWENRSMKLLPAPVLLPFVLTAVLTALALAPMTATAEISEQAYRQLKSDASEVLNIRVTKVTQVQSDEDMIHYHIEAVVRSVVRSAAGHQPNSTIKFSSYYVRPEARRNGFVGPQSPPKLQKGWTGRVYLGGENGNLENPIGPAAYGRSFEPR
jgi:hypothetical protein